MKSFLQPGLRGGCCPGVTAAKPFSLLCFYPGASQPSPRCGQQSRGGRGFRQSRESPWTSQVFRGCTGVTDFSFPNPSHCFRVESGPSSPAPSLLPLHSGCQQVEDRENLGVPWVPGWGLLATPSLPHIPPSSTKERFCKKCRKPQRHIAALVLLWRQQQFLRQSPSFCLLGNLVFLQCST